MVALKIHVHNVHVQYYVYNWTVLNKVYKTYKNIVWKQIQIVLSSQNKQIVPWKSHIAVHVQYLYRIVYSLPGNVKVHNNNSQSKHVWVVLRKCGFYIFEHKRASSEQ